MNTLILTGWGWIDYATAAAVALRHFRSANILGMSRRHLPEYLAELADGEFDYKQIIIIGIGLNKEQELLPILKQLKTQQVTVTWLSIIPLSPQLPATINKYLNIQLGTHFDGLTEFISEYYSQPAIDLLKVRNVEYQLSTTKDNLARYLLSKAAQYRYRNYQDNTAYGAAIRTLAEKSSLTKSQEAMIKHYRKYGQRELKGSSPVMTRLRAIIDKVAPKDSARVFIHGASGTGKETVAIQLHEKSPRRQKPFITFNCATTSTSLIESQLFGYVKGAFTGASNSRSGIFAEADGGTLFLDEIGELSLEIQANILRVLQEGCFNPVGSHQEIQVDVRIIAATNRDLIAMVDEGTFREDLFFRLNVIPIYIPQLSEHLEDIKDIANSFWYRWHNKALPEWQIETLKNYNWPGNVRELGNFLEYASVLEEDDFTTLLVEHRQRLKPIQRDTNESALPENLDDLTHYHAQKIFDKYQHNISRTAKVLGITRNTLKKYLAM